jgi:hypothetical protein
MVTFARTRSLSEVGAKLSDSVLMFDRNYEQMIDRPLYLPAMTAPVARLTAMQGSRVVEGVLARS